jgi:LysM repeat protein
MADDPVHELLGLLESRKAPRTPAVAPDPRRQPHPRLEFFGRRLSNEVRAGLGGLLIGLMFLLFFIIRLDPSGGSTGADLTAVSSKSLPPFWVVRSGQTLGLIAQQTGLSPVALQDLNPYVNPGTLQVGEEIRLRASAPSSPTAPKLPTFWVLKSGQTFSLIADRTGLTVPAIEALNPHANPGVLRVGERIRLVAAAKPAGGSKAAGH